MAASNASVEARHERSTLGRSGARQLADQAFSRASGAPLRTGNRVRLLKDAAENYPAWLSAIRSAERTIHVDMYFICDDAAGRQLVDALIQRARDGVKVRVLYDWLGEIGKASSAFWNRVRAGGVEVRCYNPFRPDRPLGWLSRNHRKAIVIDGRVGFITGLCVGKVWMGDVTRGIDPWRDTGVELIGPAVADLEEAMDDAWTVAGGSLNGDAASRLLIDTPAPSGGDVAVRVVATVPQAAGLLRVDQLVAAMARKTLWLTDAYYAGTSMYVEALRAAAGDGVDVRLLVPGASDLPLLRPITRAGYRALLEAGVRIFEWNGSMLHAKTAVADARWARVGSSNLNIASWHGNRELDLIVEDDAFAGQMQEMYLADLENATEVVLDHRAHVRAPGAPRGRRLAGSGGGRMAAGAIRIGHAVSAAISNTRVLEPVEANMALVAGVALFAASALAFWSPRLVAWPIAAIAVWLAAALFFRGFVLRSEAGKRAEGHDVSPSHLEPTVGRSRRREGGSR